MALRIAAILLMFIGFSAKSVELGGNLTQGGLVRGTLAQGEQLRLNGESVRVAEDGQFIIGFGRDAELTHVLTITGVDGTTRMVPLTLTPRDYHIQRIEGITQRIMQPVAADVARAQEDAIKARSARELNDERLDWQQAFIWPLHGRITGVYGSQRFYNGEPRSPHYGIDIAAPTGTPVIAPAAGLITLAEPDMFYSGGTLIIDHGFGVSSTLLHLHKLLVQPGERVTQGQVVGLVGATGRATGPHLDWRMNWLNERVDPTFLVPTMPK
ncbi:MAG: M23 family metallopeptidase [Ferrimonas sp.]